MSPRNTKRTSAAMSREVRCAIYTRKSTEEGLDQEFNSLDAQHEACAAYVQSQRQEGWTLLPSRYDDGGYSGGNMGRPGLQRLLGDVRAGKVDVIIVYKVDRLTRSLTDFAKIVEALDGAGASFVSITQSFNTTTSMGRLTLNVLLSFAQFEREVISERVRDKVAASKAKGMWMGGAVPLGYDAKDRKLTINEAEAGTVRLIMQRYLELGSVRELMDDLKQRGVRTKVQRMRDGSTRGGIRFTRGPLYHLLKNRIYLGQIVHHDKAHPGEHKPIIEQELFDAVQSMLAANVARQKQGGRSAHQSLLAGMIRDAEDRPMSPSHACKGGKRYRYYVSNISVPGDGETCGVATRIAAAETEQAIRGAVADVLERAESLKARAAGLQAATLKSGMRLSKDLAGRVRKEPVGSCRELLRSLDLQISLEAERITASCSNRRFMAAIRVGHDGMDERLTVPISIKTFRRGSELRLVFIPPGGREPKRDLKLITTMVEAHRARDELLQMDADAEGERRRDLTRSAKLSYLAPDIVTAIFEGRQPVELGARRLKRISKLPLCWDQQRALLGFA